MHNDLRIVQYYYELWWRRPLVWLIPAILVFAVGAAYILLKPKTYTAQALIVVRSDKISPTLIQSTVMNERLHFIEQRVLARDNLLALVQKFDLFPGLRDELSKTNLADIVRKQIRITPEASESSEQYVDRSVFRISFEDEAPELSAAVTSEIVRLIVNENRRTRLSQASDTTHFLEREVATATDRLHALDAKWDEFITRHQNALPSRQSAHLQQIQSIQQELGNVEANISNLDSEIRILKAELALGMPLADAELRGRAEQLSTLKAQLATRLAILSEAHPEIKTLRSRIAILEAETANASPPDAAASAANVANLGPELGLIAEKIKSAEQQHSVLTERRDRLNADLTSVKEVVARMPEVEAEMTSLERQKDATQRIMDDMAAKLNTARLGERLEFDQQADQIEVLEQAEVPEQASGPRRWKLLLVVLMLAGGAGFGSLLVADTMDRTIRGTFDVTRALDGRPLVIVPHWDSTEGAPRSTVSSIATGAAMLLAMEGSGQFNGLGWIVSGLGDKGQTAHDVRGDGMTEA